MPETSNANPVAMISSTALDLPEHREQVKDACLRMGMFPQMMEQLPAADADAVAESRRLVDEADVYLGIFAFRYGYVPEGGDISITEMEYNRAVERGIPRLIFLMRDDYPIKPSDVEKGDGARKLDVLKERLKKERVVNSYGSPEDLRGLVIHSLVSYRKPDLTAFRYVSDIPAPPEPFIAHPYTLLQTHRLVGRQPELNLLTDWVAKPDAEVYKARILSIVAVGGMGKSALTWHWFSDIAPQEMKPLAGRMWWSFYESDATFENLVTRALAYVSRRPLDEVQQIPAPECETQLLHALDREPHLLVLDGLERVLIAYARMDAARLEDSQVGNQRNLRKTADPRVGRFLKKLTQVKSSRILVSSRLYPAELETEGGDPVPGRFRLDITGLTDEDAVELWRALKVSGSRDLLLPIFNTFAKHPLLIQALAGQVKRFRRAPGDFEEWRKANPRFDPTRFPLLQDAMSHVLKFALRGLNNREQQVLQTIAAFRMPARYDTLAALFIGEGKACADERELDEGLTELEDRGLVGWDRQANRYDLHPVVRGTVWNRLSGEARREIYIMLYAHLNGLPAVQVRDVNSIEDLSTTIELYGTLVGLERYDEAYWLFFQRIHRATLHRLSLGHQGTELLESLFLKGLDDQPALSDIIMQRNTITSLAQHYQISGRHGRAVPLLERSYELSKQGGKWEEAAVDLTNLAIALHTSGSLRRAEGALRRSLLMSRVPPSAGGEAYCLEWLGLALATRGCQVEAWVAIQRAIRMLSSFGYVASFPASFLAKCELWAGNASVACSLADRVWALAQRNKEERSLIYAALRQGEAALMLGDLQVADERLHTALAHARAADYVSGELPSLIALAELKTRQGNFDDARKLLEDVWEAAERGPYPLVHADAHNVLAQVERDAGNDAKAVEAARRAYELAWCDGPPFAYHWGLEKARGLLRELGAGEPEMPAFDESKFEPMPEVEIDPADEFGAGGVEGEKAEE